MRAIYLKKCLNRYSGVQCLSCLITFIIFIMKNNKDLYSIIIPTYNQAENLPVLIFLLEEVSEAHKIQMEIIIVEDNSPDGTLAIAQKLASIFNNIMIIQRPKKLGLGSAYRDGLKRASGNFVIIMDADLSHHPKYIPFLIALQQQKDADIVTSTRYIEGGGVQGWTFMRKLTSRVANYIASLVLGSQFSDLTGSFRLYRKQVLQELISIVTTKGYSFQMQILIRGWKRGKKIEEFPIIFVDRIFGKSKLGPNEVFLYLKGMGKIFLDY